jgi:hypothetical protein
MGRFVPATEGVATAGAVREHVRTCEKSPSRQVRTCQKMEKSDKHAVQCPKP